MIQSNSDVIPQRDLDLIDPEMEDDVPKIFLFVRSQT